TPRAGPAPHTVAHEPPAESFGARRLRAGDRRQRAARLAGPRREECVRSEWGRAGFGADSSEDGFVLSLRFFSRRTPAAAFHEKELCPLTNTTSGPPRP